MPQKFPITWSLLTKINYLQRKIMLNSIAYYEHDISFLSDSFYDSISHQLADMQQAYNRHDCGADFVRDSRYGYAFYDFTGDTGYHLYNRLTDKDKEELQNMTKIQLYITAKNKGVELWK